jgi:hypothetical protein
MVLNWMVVLREIGGGNSDGSDWPSYRRLIMLFPRVVLVVDLSTW